MKERYPGFNVLNQPSIKEQVQKNWLELKKNTCACPHCLEEFDKQIVFHICSADPKQQKFMTKETLTEDVRAMQTRERAVKILEPVQLKKGKWASL